MKPPKFRRLFYNLLKTKSRSFQNERDRIFSGKTDFISVVGCPFHRTRNLANQRFH